MAQQTAVEWLYNKLSTCTSDEMVGNINNWFEQAKQMEKEQIIKAHGLKYYDLNEETVNGEQYFNETYGK